MRKISECLEVTNQYIDDILTDKIPVCRLVKATYQRHLDDLKRVPDDDWAYEYDPKRGAEVIKFLELLQHVSGPLARQNFKLEPWQLAALMVLYGWVRKDDGYRRFTKAQIFLARKGGKSFLLSGLALYHLIDPRDGGSQIYSVSVKRDIAKLTFDVSRQMLITDPKFAKAFGLEYNNLRVYQESSGSYFRALSKDTHGQSTDGANSSFILVDEIHLMESRALYDSLITSTGARAEPLVFGITTAGFSKTSVAYHLYEYGKKILTKEIVDDSVFFLAYMLDPEDLVDPIRVLTDETLWAKANPNLGVSCFINDMRNLATQALNSPIERPNFITKRLNAWTSSSSVYIPSERISSVQVEINLDELVGDRLILGIDAASRNDFFGLGFYFPATDKRKAIAFDEVFLNKKQINQQVNYKQWVKDGLLKECGERVTDHEVIKQRVVQLSEMFELESIFYDPHTLESFAQQLKNEGLNLYKHYQNHRSYNIAMKELSAMVDNEEVDIGNSALLSWQFENVVAKHDSNDLVMPGKVSAGNKIDGVVAILMALGGYLRNLEYTQEEDNSKKWSDYSVRTIDL